MIYHISMRKFTSSSYTTIPESFEMKIRTVQYCLPCRNSWKSKYNKTARRRPGKDKRMTKRSLKELQYISAHIGGIVKISQKNVPYLLLSPGRYSICWFGKGRFFRSWKNCGTKNNERYMDFKTKQDVIFHFRCELGYKKLSSLLPT